MRITIFGANGKVGSLVVKKALAAGHQVTAAVHSGNSLDDHPNLTVMKCDIYNLKDVKSALTGSEAVVSALGSWGTPKKNVLSAAMENIIPTMKENGISKIVSLTGAGANYSKDSSHPLRAITHMLAGVVAGRILEDGEKHISLLSKSNLDWTVIRSPVMTNSKNEKFKLNYSPNLSIATIPRAAVIAAIVGCLTEQNFNKAAPFIHRA